MNGYANVKGVSFDHIQIYLIRVSENYRKINMSLIPQVQLKEIGSYRLEKDRDKRLLSRSFLYDLTYKQFGVRDFAFDYNKFHKPFLRALPRLSFSFSYADDFVLVGVSAKRQLGVDIEFVDQKINIGEIAPEIMCKEEMKKFQSYADNIHLQRKFFFDLFSAKESIIKAFGMGLYFNVKELNILSGNIFEFSGSVFQTRKLDLWEDQFALSVCFGDSEKTSNERMIEGMNSCINNQL